MLRLSIKSDINFCNCETEYAETENQQKGLPDIWYWCYDIKENNQDEAVKEANS